MKKYVVIFSCILFLASACRHKLPLDNNDITSAEESAKPWVFWYWMHGAVTKEAVTADLESMAEAGIGGAYIFSIRDVPDPPLYEPSIRTTTPEWWDMVRHTMKEADRLGLKLGMNSCDGFTTAGGPWITPEMSMQKVVWADTVVSGIQEFNAKLPQPEFLEDFYRDIAVFAYPAPDGAGESSFGVKPRVTTNLTGEDVKYLADEGNDEIFSTSVPCWIQYSFEKPFTCRSVTIGTGWNNYQSNRLKIEISDDGKNFRFVCRLEPPRSGWQDLDANATHLINPVTARFFRFVYDPDGSEPGAEDIDDAKWKPTLRIKGIELSGESKINQFEGKSGAIWRISKRFNEVQLPSSRCIDKGKLINIGDLQPDGKLKWSVPAGEWVILRMGHTSTGHTNYVGGGGLGLECDKLNSEVAAIQFDKWFGETIRQVGPDLAEKVLKRFHVDSWECGSQNWSPVFIEEFKERRGYNLLPYLPVMAGVPVESADFSERILSDVRQTISELMVDNFYNVLAEKAHGKGCLFSSESVAPVMVSDGMLHFRETDLPMNEFWFRSPSHDKPNDMIDAISAAHIYGKNIVQSESFTEIRLDWDEHPGVMKILADRNFALGVNRLVFHVFTLNPWQEIKPGMTVDKVGTFFQRDQTWWKPGKAFVRYITNCQKMLQQGNPVVDIAVFTGEEIPRRAVLPDRLVSVLPGIFGKERVEQERIRLLNERIPIRELPGGVKTQVNMADPDKWVDPLRGYAYDSFNRDALLNLASVEDGRIVLPGGASYGLLVIPGSTKMSPDGGDIMSVETAQKLLDLTRLGATILLIQRPYRTPGLDTSSVADQKLKEILDELYYGEKTSVKDADSGQFIWWRSGRGRVIQGPYEAASFNELGIQRDFLANDEADKQSDLVAWNHRREAKSDIYFIANQMDKTRTLELSFRIENKTPELFNPVTGETRKCKQWQNGDGRTKLTYRFEPNESLFVIFKDERVKPQPGKNWIEPVPAMKIEGSWSVKFDPAFGGPENPVDFSELTDWSKNSNSQIKFYSGTATYCKTFHWEKENTPGESYWLELGSFANIADVKLNDISCGICWTNPFRVNIDSALIKGENYLEIAITNTWANRLIGDHDLPEEKQITRTTAPYRLEGKPLLPAGLFGPVTISIEMK